MTEALRPARPFNASHRGDCLHDLVVRVATGDRTAFRVLYAFLAMRVWRDAVQTLPHPVDARAVMRSTFIEVWHLAGHHLDDDGPDIDTWIAAITARRVHDRLRDCDTHGRLRDDHDDHTHREIVALLGAGHAVIRTGPGTFTRVADLDLAP
jgi:DNA-directed RNA polymerase specialized sigma24 family protein